MRRHLALTFTLYAEPDGDTGICKERGEIGLSSGSARVDYRPYQAALVRKAIEHLEGYLSGLHSEGSTNE